MVGVPALITETFSCSYPKHHRARTHKPEVNKHRRGHLLKEAFRAVFRARGEEEARGLLGEWPSWACRCRTPQFAELPKKARRKAGGIVRSVAPGVSSARVEAANDKVEVAIRQAYGFRNIDNLIALVMLRCSPLEPCPPGRARKPKRKRGRGLQAAPA